MKVQMNKNNKTKPAFIVDITNCETSDDMAFEFAMSKYNAGIALTDYNLLAIIYKTCDICLKYTPRTTYIVECECNSNKLPWYKRFWKKIKNLFTR